MEYRISAVITTFNRAKIVVDAIESVFAQTYPVFELLLIDDGSTDETASVVQEMFRSAPIPCRYVKKENGGMATSLNCGVGESKGEWIAFLDDDDLWGDDHIERCIDIVKQQPSLKCVAGLREEKGVLQSIPEKMMRQFIKGDANGCIFVKRKSPLVAPFFTPVVGTALIKKDTFENVLFSTEVGARLDVHFFWRLSELTDIVIDNRSHGIARQFRVSYLSTDDDAPQVEKNKIVLKRNQDELKMLANILAIVEERRVFEEVYRDTLIGRSYLLRNIGDFSGARRYLRGCIGVCSIFKVVKEYILIVFRVGGFRG